MIFLGVFKIFINKYVPSQEGLCCIEQSKTRQSKAKQANKHF
jgi:hypothetical protein